MPGRVLSLLLLLCTALLPPIALSAEGAADVSQASLQLGIWSRVIRDPDHTLSVDELLAHPEHYPGSQGAAINSFTFTDAAYWFVIPLHNPQQTALSRVLSFEPIWLDDIRVTLASSDGQRQRFHSGDFLPFSTRSLAHRKINFTLKLPPGYSQLLVRVQTVDPFVVNMQLSEQSAFYQADSLETAYLGLVYGVLGAMLLYNLMLFVVVRESVYAAYVGYVLFFMLWHAINNGMPYQLLWPASPLTANWSQSISLYLIMITGLYFAINFLQLRYRMPRTYYWVMGIFSLLIASSLLTALGGYQLHVTSGVLWVIAYTVIVLALGLLSLLNGNRAARYFLPGTTAGFVGSGITALAVSGYIPFTTYTYRAVDFGMLLDAILLSIALADRLKIARLEADQARSALFDAVQQHTQDLEAEVVQRTRELREANVTKDKFFSIIAHDLRGPLCSLALFYNDIVKSSADFTDEILELTRDTTNQTRNLLEQLLIWARSQRGEIDFTPQAFDLSLLMPEIVQLFSTQARGKGIHLDINIDGPCWVYADKAMVLTILRNLTSNALKYTAAGGSINATLTNVKDFYKFSIHDNGIGMSERTRQRLFRPDLKPQSIAGTQNEHGTGLGLILCHEFVQRNCGDIGVQSELGKGSTFWFTLPNTATQAISGPRITPGLKTELKILLADDQRISRETSSQILYAMKQTVSFARDGAEAVQMASEQDFDLILMDIDMPVLNGIEATRIIRASKVPCYIIALSSYCHAEIEQLADGDIFDAYLEKPLSKDQLIKELARLFAPTEG